MAGLALPVSNSLPNSPGGKRPMSSPNMQNMSFMRKWAALERLDALLPQAVGQLGEALGRLDGHRLAGDAGLERAGIGEDAAEDVEIGRPSASPARSKAWTCLAVPVKFVWTSKRSMSQTTSSGGFSRASR